MGARGRGWVEEGLGGTKAKPDWQVGGGRVRAKGAGGSQILLFRRQRAV